MDFFLIRQKNRPVARWRVDGVERAVLGGGGGSLAQVALSGATVRRQGVEGAQEVLLAILKHPPCILVQNLGATLLLLASVSLRTI